MTEHHTAPARKLSRQQIRAQARDERGKERKVVVSARNGYYLPNK